VTANRGLVTTTLRGLAWAIDQSWSGKVPTRLIYLVQVRMFEAAQLSVALAVVVMLSLIALISHFYVSEALVWRCRGGGTLK
jgi:hypothetical protein